MTRGSIQIFIESGPGGQKQDGNIVTGGTGIENSLTESREAACTGENRIY
jgi:hypothetical protein